LNIQKKKNGNLFGLFGFIVMEQWVVIPDFPMYQISNLGRVRRGHRYLDPCTNQYRYVSLCVNSKKTNRYVHRLVAELFTPNFDKKKKVIHIDGDINNNRLDNLRWVTHQRRKQERLPKLDL
jgi:hypothetical protein